MITKIVLLQHKRLTLRIDVVQNTNAVPIKFILADYVIPRGSEARIYIKKPSGLEIYNNCEIKDNNIIVQPTTQMYAEAGWAKAQVQIITGTTIAASFPVWFNIAENIISESSVESRNEIGVLNTLIKEAQDAIERIEESIRQNRSYICGITSDNGIVFKNNAGRTTLTAQVKNGTIDITGDYIIRWYKDGSVYAATRSITVDSADIVDKSVYKFTAHDESGTQVGEYEVTIANVYDGQDGKDGKPGKDGIPGIDGINGKTTYFHIAYADDEFGNGFSQYPSEKSHLGTYVDFTAADSEDPSVYRWAKIEGAQGEAGGQGIPGVNGIDGRTSYLHVAYAYDEFGNGFSQESSNKPYMGTYTDYALEDSTDPSRYTWVKIQGKQGLDGESGIIISEDQPDSPYVGQLWQTESGESIKRWNGSEWVLWYMAVTNLNVENLAAIAATIGTVSNSYETDVESEWSNEALTGKITIGGAGIKNEYTYKSNGWNGMWRLNPQSYYAELRDASGNLREGVSVESVGINFYDFSTATWVGATASTLDKMSKMFATITVTADNQVQINSTLRANAVLSGGQYVTTARSTNRISFNWTGNKLEAYVDNVKVGNITLS